MWQVYIKSQETKLNRWGVTYFTRSDKYPSQKNLVNADRSQNVSVITELLKNEHHQFKFNATYRKLNVTNPGITAQKSDESLLGRVEYAVNEWTRISVEHIVGLLAQGWSESQILENYPRLTQESLQAVFSYIQECMHDGLLFSPIKKSA